MLTNDVWKIREITESTYVFTIQLHESQSLKIEIKIPKTVQLYPWQQDVVT